MSPEFDPMRIPVGDRSDLAGAVRSAAERLPTGRAVLYPTETFRALGADPRSGAGCAAVSRLRGRRADCRRPRLAADGERAGAGRRFPEVAAAPGHRGEREYR